MVKVREDYIEDLGGDAGIERWLGEMAKLTKFRDIEEVRRACRTSLEIEAKAVEEERIWAANQDRKSTRLNSSHSSISDAVFCLNKLICAKAPLFLLTNPIPLSVGDSVGRSG